LESRPERSRVVVVVSGELDMETVPLVREAFDQLRDAGWTSVVLDARRLTFVDSQGLHLLIALDRDARSRAWAFSLADGSPPLARLLDLVGLRDHFDRADLH
jgi:anti-sigma B factor antagonist